MKILKKNLTNKSYQSDLLRDLIIRQMEYYELIGIKIKLNTATEFHITHSNEEGQIRKTIDLKESYYIDGNLYSQKTLFIKFLEKWDDRLFRK